MFTLGHPPLIKLNKFTFIRCDFA